MSDLKPIFILPDLLENQVWACEQGCTVRKPKLHNHVYSQQWDKQGNLVKQLTEKYYTCQYGHILAVWDENECDYVVLEDVFYQDVEV